MIPAGYTGKILNILHSEKTGGEFEMLFPEFSCSLESVKKICDRRIQSICRIL